MAGDTWARSMPGRSPTRTACGPTRTSCWRWRRARPPDAVPLLAERGRKPEGVPAGRMALYHLGQRDTTNPKYPNSCPFSLQFARLSPYSVMGMLGCNDAQTDRYLLAYEACKGVLRELGIFPQRGASKEDQARQERILRGLDDFEL